MWTTGPRSHLVRGARLSPRIRAALPPRIFCLLSSLRAGQGWRLVLPLSRLQEPLRGVTFQCDGQENVLGRAEWKDDGVILYQRGADDQVPILIAGDHLLLEAMQDVNV
jgi:hypothetical protein